MCSSFSVASAAALAPCFSHEASCRHHGLALTVSGMFVAQTAIKNLRNQFHGTIAIEGPEWEIKSSGQDPIYGGPTMTYDLLGSIRTHWTHWDPSGLSGTY